MKKLEKWLSRPIIQRVVYLLLLLLVLQVNSSNGNFNSLGSLQQLRLSFLLLVLIPVLLLAAQLIWNRRWLWWMLCAFTIGFTLWLATLSLPQIISGAGSGARPVVWGVGVIGFTLLLIVALAFVNWMLLHMKPKR